MGIWVLTIVWAMGVLAWTALCTAWLGKTRQGWLYWLLLTPWVLYVIGGSVFIAVVAYSILQRNTTPSYMPHAITFAVLLTVGSLTIVIAGNRRRDGHLAAGSWPALRLFLAWIIIGALQIAVGWYLDSGAGREMEQAREQIYPEYSALLKPVQSPESNAADLYSEALNQISTELAAADAAEEQRLADELTKPTEATTTTANAGTEIGDWPQPATKPSDLLSFGNVDDPRTASIVRSLEPAVAKLREASLRPVCRFDRNQEPPDMERALPSMAKFRTAAFLLRCHAVIEARSRRFSSAMEDVEALQRMDRHIQQTTPGLVPFLVGLGSDAQADQALAEILPYTNAPVPVPAAIQVSDQVLAGELRAALVGEYAFEVRTVLDICDGRKISNSGAPIPQRAAMAYRILYLHADLTAFRQMHEALMARLDEHGLPHKPAWTSGGERPPGGLISQILMPSFSRIFNKAYPNRQAGARAAAVAIALTNQRIDHSRYPASLEQLVPKYLPAVPADPFDGKSMRYLLNDGQATIYSVGDDRVDDGGQLEFREGDPPTKTLDVGLVLKAPMAK